MIITGRTRRRVDQATAVLGPRALSAVADTGDLKALDVLMNTIKTR